MPPLVVGIAGVLGAVAVARWIYRESARINAELHPEDGQSDLRDGPRRKLVRDPLTGHYRPER